MSKATIKGNLAKKKENLASTIKIPVKPIIPKMALVFTNGNEVRISFAAAKEITHFLTDLDPNKWYSFEEESVITTVNIDKLYAIVKDHNL